MIIHLFLVGWVMYFFVRFLCKFYLTNTDETDRHSYASFVDLRLSVFKYISGFYNSLRPHSHNNGLSPIQAEGITWFFVYFFGGDPSGKRYHLHLIYLLHLHLEIRAVQDFVLFRKLVHFKYALYAVSVRQTEALLRASFRLRLTTEALALC